MSYDFSNVNLLSYTHTPKFLDAGLRYGIEQNLTLRGTLRDRFRLSGVSGILSGQNNLLINTSDYQPIILNGIDFGEGKVTNIDFSDGNWVNDNEYIYEVICYQTGNLFNALSGVYSGISWDSNTYLIDNLEESFSYSKDADQALNYQHSVNVRYNKQVSALSGINLAKVFATNLFNSVGGIFPFLGQYQNLGRYKKLYTETYDLIQGACGFNAVTKILPNETGGYSYTLDYRLELGENGYTTITENANIQGVFAPRIQYAQSGYDILNTGSFGRANAVYGAYGFSTLPLYTGAISVGVSKNNRLGTVDFTKTFSNNPRYTGLAIWEYSNEIQESAEGFIEVSENGSIIGYGRPYIDKYSNAALFYDSYVAPTINSRLGVLYTGYAVSPKSLIIINKSLSREESKGQINYAQTLTDNNLFVNQSGIKKSEVIIEINNPSHVAVPFNIFNYKEIIQPQNIVTQGNISVNINLKGQRGLDLTGYLAYAKNIVRPYTLLGTDPYVEDVSYQISPLLNDFSMNAVIKFHSGYKFFGDTTLS